jgi:nitroimidazol reductase NimA-like FMN-containing flavoprotein (pyridoxamine 5'-phosphate oxidase superfamily)
MKVGTFDSCVNPQTTPRMSGMQAMSGSIVDLGREDSLALLASAPVGRIVFTRGALPAIHPVNFVLEGDDVVITTSEDSALLSAVAESIVAFEADEIDAANHEAWSVVVTGRARLVTDRQNIERLRVIMRTSARPAESARFIRIRPEIVSGRRIGTTL